MLRQEILREIPQKFSTGPNAMGNLRKNLFLYVNTPGISIREIAEDANISQSTLISVLYGDSKDCRMNTAIALAKALDVSIDELMGGCTTPEELQDITRLYRELPAHAKHVVLWLIRHLHAVYSGIPKEDHVISMMKLHVTNSGDLRFCGFSDTLNITKIDRGICRKVFCGLQLGVDSYMPEYSPYDILLIANDRKSMCAEDSVILLDGNLYLARRRVEGGIPKYYSIRDGRYRIKESECDEVIGYVAYTITGIDPLKELP